MPSTLQVIFDDVSRRRESYRTEAESGAMEMKARAEMGFGGPYAMAASTSITGGTANLAVHQVQYRYFRDWVYAAIRPVAVRIAGQSFKVGRKLSKPEIRTAKAAGVQAGMNWLTRTAAPEFIAKEADDIKIIESHPLLDAIEDPNDVHTAWAIVYLTVCNLQITGKAYWWLTEARDGRLMIWPLPSTWVRPDHSEGMFGRWLVTVGNSADAISVDGNDICYFSYPDPSNPLGAFSPMQASAKAISVDEQIQNSQLQSYKNGIRPGVILKAGRKPGLPGLPQSGDRVTLTPEQRTQIINAIKLAYQGWEHHSDPAIVDGLIDEIVPFTNSPREMDYMDSSRMNEDRIWLGFGVNAISAGKREGANRASAYVADDHLCSNVVNPLITLISQTATKKLAPRFAREGEKLKIWIEKAKPHDADLELARMSFANDAGALTIDEIRQYVGKPPKGGDADKLKSELPQPTMPPPQAGTQRPGAGGGQPPPPK